MTTPKKPMTIEDLAEVVGQLVEEVSNIKDKLEQNDELLEEVRQTRSQMSSNTQATNDLSDTVRDIFGPRLDNLDAKSKDIVPAKTRRKNVTIGVIVAVLAFGIFGTAVYSNHNFSVNNCKTADSAADNLKRIVDSIGATAENTYQRAQINGNPKTIALAKEALTGTKIFVAMEDNLIVRPDCTNISIL